MHVKGISVAVLGVAVLAVAASPMRAQDAPGQRERGAERFEWGPGAGVRFMGMGGCFFGEPAFAKDSSAPYDLSVQRVDTRAVLDSSTPSVHTDDYSIFRDTNGVIYLQTTRNSKTMVCINDPANRVRFVVNLTAPNSNAGTALEFKLPEAGPRFGNGSRPNAGENSRWNGKTGPDITRVTGASQTQIAAYVASAPPSWFTACTGLDLTAIKRGQFQNVRIFCSSLGVNLYTATTDPYGTSVVTATIITPPAALQLPVQYTPGQNPPLPPSIVITQVDGRPRGRMSRPGGSPQP